MPSMHLEKVNGLQKHLDEIKVPISSYTARHCYANTLKQKGVDVAMISETLGHQDVKTTQAYLKKFENSTLDEVDKVL